MADGRGGDGRGSVRVGLAVIEYGVRRSARRRKTVSIAIAGEPSGEGEAVRIPVEVAAPLATPAAELEEMVRRRAPWILQRAAERSGAAPALRFVSGETLPLLGRASFRWTSPKAARARRRYGTRTGASARSRPRASARKRAGTPCARRSSCGTAAGRCRRWRSA